MKDEHAIRIRVTTIDLSNGHEGGEEDIFFYTEKLTREEVLSLREKIKSLLPLDTGDES